MEPPRVGQLKNLAPHEQVIELEIRHIHETIERDLELSKVHSCRRFNLSYEDFCENPKSKIKEIINFLQGIPVRLHKEKRPQILSSEEK